MFTSSFYTITIVLYRSTTTSSMLARFTLYHRSASAGTPGTPDTPGTPPPLRSASAGTPGTPDTPGTPPPLRSASAGTPGTPGTPRTPPPALSAESPETPGALPLKCQSAQVPEKKRRLTSEEGTQLRARSNNPCMLKRCLELGEPDGSEGTEVGSP